MAVLQTTTPPFREEGGGGADRLAEWTIVAAAAVVLGLALPLGLGAGDASDQVAQAFGVRRPFLSPSPLADVLVRFAAMVPVGQAGVRAHLVAAMAAAIALALLAARLRLLGEGQRLTMPAFAGLALLGLSRPFLEVATLHPDAAVDFCVLAGLTVALERVWRSGARSSTSGLALAFLCGLAAGVSWPVRGATWPLALGITGRAFFRGHRWSLLAPTSFVAGTGIAVAGAVSSLGGPAINAATLWHQLIWPPTWLAPSALDARQLAAWVIDDAGVLGLLVAAVGTCWLLVRQRAQTLLWGITWGGATAGSLWTGHLLTARLLTVAALALPVAAAVAFFAGSFGKARAAVAVVMLVVLAVPPAIVGTSAVARLPGRRDATAVARKLDAAFAAAASSAAAAAGPAAAGASKPSSRWPQPEDEDAARWWRYGVSTGLMADDAGEGGGGGVRNGLPPHRALGSASRPEVRPRGPDSRSGDASRPAGGASRPGAAASRPASRILRRGE